MSLVAVNIPSFASGMDVWGKADRCGLRGKQLTGPLSETQIMGDGQIEFVCFSSAASLGAEVVSPTDSDVSMQDEFLKYINDLCDDAKSFGLSCYRRILVMANAFIAGVAPSH